MLYKYYNSAVIMQYDLMYNCDKEWFIITTNLRKLYYTNHILQL